MIRLAENIYCLIPAVMLGSGVENRIREKHQTNVQHQR